MPDAVATVPLLEAVKIYIRVTNEVYNSDVQDLINAAKAELKRVKVDVTGMETDPLLRQAAKFYAKANFSSDANAARYQLAFENIRDSLALSGDYIISEGENDAG